MKPTSSNVPLVAIACGGTGGHLFPGLAVARQLRQAGCDVALLISPKEVDQQAVKAAAGMTVHTLPAVGLQNRNYLSFLASLVRSVGAARKIFRERRPVAVLAMGGFTSAPPVLLARALGIKTFLHDSNAIPGRANRWLAPWVTEAFLGFAAASARLNARKKTVTGTPVRAEFQVREAGECRAALGLDPVRPTVLVVGGSQGARGLNDLVLAALPQLADRNWQWLHLTGGNDFEKVKAAYAQLGLRAVVKPFLAEMDLALGAATAAVSRAGASSLAEMAAVRLPTLLVPLPTAVDNHQFYNAELFVADDAAWLQEQKSATPGQTAARLVQLMEDEAVRRRLQTALERWHVPGCAREIAVHILRQTGRPVPAAAVASAAKPFIV